MTREQIEAMEPGRELDGFVAKHVMGWQRVTCHETAFPPHVTEFSIHELEYIPDFSTNSVAHAALLAYGEGK